MGYQPELEVALALCEQTDAIAMEHFAVDIATETKADGTPVTVADRAVETAIRAALSAAFPTDAIIGEEFGSEGESSRRWIVDPIDGTRNYARGVPVFATLIALEQDGRLVLGVVSAPALRTRWWATAGDGAYHDGVSMQVSDRATLASSDVITGGVRWAQDRTHGLIKVLRTADRSRGFGDFWGHMLVAQGSAEAMIEFAPLALWDIAAPKMIVTEAGGRVTTLDGDDALQVGPALTSNGVIHAEVLAALG